MNTTRLAVFGRPVRVWVASSVLAVVCCASAEDEGGIRLGPAYISPTLSIGVYYESNPDEVNENRKELMEDEDEERDDATKGFNIQPGLHLRLPGNSWNLSGSLICPGYANDNTDNSRDRQQDWGETLTLAGVADGGTSWALGQSAQQTSFQQYDEFSQDDRFSLGVNGSLGRQITDKSGLSVGAGYRMTDYEDEYLYDSQSQQYTLSFSHQLTEKTDGILSLAYGINSADFNEVTGREIEAEAARRRLDVDIKDATSFTASLGLGSRATEKISYRALIGMTAYDDFEYDYGEAVEYLYRGQELDNDKDTRYSVSYSLSLNWTPTDRFSMSLSGNSGYEPSEDVRNNSLLAYSLICSANYRFFARVMLSGGIAYRYEDFLHNVDEDEVDLFTGTEVEGQGQSRRDDQVNLFAGLTFGLTRYASFYMRGNYLVVESTIDDFDYDRYLLSAGVALQY